MTIHRRSTRAAARIADAPALKILLYIDAQPLLPGRTYGPERLIGALAAGPLPVHVDVQCREDGARLTSALLEPFHEAWFFLKKKRGAELGHEERAALREWMDRGGGVLVAGDHAEKKRGESYVGLGADVGALIPRAGDLRRWDEPPSRDTEDEFDTLDDAFADPANERNDLERDARPQRLLLPPVDGDRPHPIFREAAGRALDRFPDHMHEGEVKACVDLTAPDWAGTTDATRPQVVARGIDWRHGRVRDLMALWDGHALASPRGRIVADSSFHHYVDDNLEGIARANCEDWRRIQALFRNIAAWLAPPAVKRAHRERALDWLARHARIDDLDGHDDRVVGRAAARLFADVLPPVWLHELIRELALPSRLSEVPSKVRDELEPRLLGRYVSTWRQRPPAAVSRRRRGAKAMAPASAAPSPAQALRGAIADYAATLQATQDELARIVAGLKPDLDPKA